VSQVPSQQIGHHQALRNTGTEIYKYQHNDEKKDGMKGRSNATIMKNNFISFS